MQSHNVYTKFCQKCGTRLREVRVSKSYDSKTGEKIRWVVVRCPKSSVLGRLFLDGHYSGNIEYARLASGEWISRGVSW